MAKEEKKGNAPIFHIKNGALEVACWRNEGKKNAVFYSLSFKRSYTEDEGKTFEETQSLRVRDLLPLKEMLGQAYLKIQDLIAEDKKGSDDED